MRLGQLIRDLGRDLTGIVNHTRLSDKAGGVPSMPTFSRYCLEQPLAGSAEEALATGRPGVWRTEWGTIATRKEAIDVESVVGVAKALATTDKVVWLAVGESIGLRGMFDAHSTTAVEMLPAGWDALDPGRASLMRQYVQTLVTEQRDGTTLAQMTARIAELEAELESLAPLRRALDASVRGCTACRQGPGV